MPIIHLKHAIRRVGQMLAPAATLALLASRTWLHEPEMKLLGVLAGRRRLAIDVGANKGVYVMRLARSCQRVVAFEPLPEMARFLRRGAPANVQVVEAALSDKDGRAVLHVPGDFDERGSIEAGVSTPRDAMHDFQVERRTLDSYNFDGVDLIKIDVEGHEAAVLLGASQTIARCRPALLVEVEERHAAGAVKRVTDILAALDYRGFFLDGREIQPLSAFDPARDQNISALRGDARAGRYINNLIFLHRAVADERLAQIHALLHGHRPQTMRAPAELAPLR